jgi:hypothetical protein
MCEATHRQRHDTEESERLKIYDNSCNTCQQYSTVQCSRFHRIFCRCRECGDQTDPTT